MAMASDSIKEAAKKPLRGGGVKAGPLRFFFKDRKKSHKKNVASKLEGG